MMVVTVDIGNTRIKAAVFEQNRLEAIFAFDSSVFNEKISEILFRYPDVADIVVASVTHQRWDDVALPTQKKVHFLSHTSVFPFISAYETPQTLGIDRMILASGAGLQYPDCNRLVIGAGTCIPYDFIDQRNV